MQCIINKKNNAFSPFHPQGPALQSRDEWQIKIKSLRKARPLSRTRLVRDLGWRVTGFTFVETLIVCAMVFVVSLAIYTTLTSGIRIWRKVNQTVPEEDINIFFDKFSTDLKNSFRFTGINFMGTNSMIEVSTLVTSTTLKSKTVGQVIYSYNPAKKTLDRQQRDFSNIYNNEDAKISQLIENAETLQFQYYFYDEEKKEYLWQDQWQRDGLPLAVKVEFDYADATRLRRFTKTVSIPASS